MKLESQNQSFFTNIANGINQYIVLEPSIYSSMSEHYKKFVLKPLLANTKEKYIVIYSDRPIWSGDNMDEFIDTVINSLCISELEVRNWLQ